MKASLKDTDHSLREPDNLRRALQAAGVSLWSWNVDTDNFTMGEQGFAHWAADEAH